MTDLQAFIDLYTRLGIDCNVNQCAETGNQFIILTSKDSHSDYENEKPTESDKLQGYYGFYSKVEFDKDGIFLNQGFWE